MSHLVIISKHDSCSLFASGLITDMKVHLNGKEQTTDNIQWPAIDIESGFVVLGNGKSFLEHPQILTGTLPYFTPNFN